MSYENYLLFESLAKQGFIVASVSSVGRYPGNMSMDIPDLFEQVNDAKFIIGHLAKKELVTDDIGLVGYSWGGLAASIMAMAEPEKFKALVSLDGSEQFSYGDSFDNEKLNHIRGLNLFKPEKIKSSYLYLDSDINETELYPDSIYNITKFVSSDKYYLRIKGTKHEDFSCISYISNTADSTNRYRLIRQLTVSYLQEKIKHQKMFLKNIPPEMVENQFTPQTRRRDSDAGEQMISGFITDKKSNQPLQYVNVGLMNKDKGTTTLKNGAFKLNLSESNLEDTLKISMVGYAPRTFYLKDLLKGPQSHLNIQLKEKTEELKEVVVTRNKLTTRVLGNKTESRFFGGKFASKDLGSEIAIKIKIRKAPTHLNKFTFNVSYNTTDTSTFRVNVYTVKNGLPDKNVLSKNLIKRIAKQTGKIELDLSKQNIVVNDDFFISLEWIEGNKNSGVTFSSGFVNKGTYYRKASQGLWKKYPMGVGFNVTASY